VRILVINSTVDLYGANRVLYCALSAFPETARVEILLPQLTGPLIDLLQKDFPEIILRKNDSIPIVQRKLFSVKGFGMLFNQMATFYSFLKNENTAEKIDLLYVNTLSNFFVLPIAKILKIPVLTHVHEILDHPKLIAVIFSRYSVIFSDHIIVVSDAVRKGLGRWSRKQDLSKITVIHNGIHDMFDAKYSSTKIGKVIITLVARIKPEKGIWYFIDALQKLKNPELVAAKIVGGAAPFGEHHIDKLNRDIKSSKVEIEYVPFTLDVSSYINGTDILVVPTLIKDSFPTTVLEGMSCGKPVISSNTGGAVEAIEDNVSGMLIGPDDVAEFTNKIELLVSDPNLRIRIGNSARQSYLNNYTIDIYTKNLSTYLSNLPSLNLKS
jgi:glycosyltransferase involved in cell wall biosynthesis